MKIGRYIQQPNNYKAFIPDEFPPSEQLLTSPKTQQLHARAALLLGKLDGITQLLPDLDFFIFSYIRKEATKSSEIEGTQATEIDVIKTEADLEKTLPDDVDRILHYVSAMDYGLERLKEFPMSLRFIREVHKILIAGTKDEVGKTPGEFRKSQNWVGGGSLQTATYIPPTPHEMQRNLDDLEKFLNSEKNDYPPLIKAALVHAQFETIHPFLDGNGRTGRLLTTFYLCRAGLLEKPVLYLSDYFMANKQAYYDSLQAYHSERGDIGTWINFFLDGVAIVAESAVKTSKSINKLRQKDVFRIQSLGRRSEMGMVVLDNLYRIPIISVKTVEKWTGLSRESSNNLVRELVRIGILEQRDKSIDYGREFYHKEYLGIFKT